MNGANMGDLENLIAESVKELVRPMLLRHGRSPRKHRKHDFLRDVRIAFFRGGGCGILLGEQ